MATHLSAFGEIIAEIRDKLVPLANEAWRIRVFVNDAPEPHSASGDYHLDGVIKELEGLLTDLRFVRERKDQYRADLSVADGYIAEIERLRRTA
jgi:hypothetical protein